MSTNGNTRQSWQEQLNEHCRKFKIPAPVFNLVSDRRGGRTAWSSSVNIQGYNYPARYFYAGEFINNAKEDAAEVAFTKLNSQPPITTALPGQLYAQQK
ncbi:hypothetical protein FQN49_005977 [Arthroderma sp. PD_2]|nr:hypothetical protein FQN49_005977 [Arthroderma sp. PD_2]